VKFVVAGIVVVCMTLAVVVWLVVLRSVNRAARDAGWKRGRWGIYTKSGIGGGPYIGDDKKDDSSPD
jgi:hypothetical protein